MSTKLSLRDFIGWHLSRRRENEQLDTIVEDENIILVNLTETTHDYSHLVIASDSDPIISSEMMFEDKDEDNAIVVPPKGEVESDREATLLAAFKKTAEKQQQQFGQEYELDEAQYLADIVRDLKAPLYNIIAFIRLMEQGDPLTELQQYFLDKIETNSERLGTLIDELLYLSSMESGQTTVNREKVDMAAIVSEVVHEGNQLIKEKRVTLAMKQSTPVPPVYADPDALRQVLMSLITNAISFTDQGSITVEFGQRDDTKVYVSVTDTGLGIPKEHVDLIFQEFSRLPPTDEKQGGLEPAIATLVAQMYGAEFAIKNVSDKGNTFEITLPKYLDDSVETS